MIHIVPILKDNYAYIIEAADKNCIIVDAGESAPIELFIRANNLKPTLILCTHHHSDHVAGNQALVDAFKIPVIGPEAERALIPAMTRGVREGDVIDECGIKLKVIETPGHTKGHVVFYCEQLSALFSGDTLFSLGCGRLLEDTAEAMYESLQKLKRLPPETNIYCGHEYTKSNGEFALSIDPGNADLQSRMKDIAALRADNKPTVPVTLEIELKTNPFLLSPDAVHFAAIRKQKDSF